MAIVKPTNFGKAGLATPPSGTGGLSFTVTAGKGANFPTLVGGEYFYGVFTNAARSAYEIVKIEARSGDGFTIASGGRGLDGTSAATWTTSDIFYFPTTRVMWDDIGAFKVALLALQPLTPAADKLPYFTGAAAAAVTDFSSYARTLVAGVSAAASRLILGFPAVAAKGDLASGSAADTLVTTSVGVDGTVLTASSAASGGVAWQASGFTTGDAKPTFKVAADTGWIMANDGSIGSATSGATTRANADTEPLFTLLWNNIVDLWAPVFDSSGAKVARGANAAADFAANRRLAIPKILGRALAFSGTGSFTTSFTANAGTDELTIDSNSSVYTGATVQVSSTTTLPAGLSAATNYFVIRTSATIVKLATSLANAHTGTPIDITSAGSGVHTMVMALTARALGEHLGEEVHSLTLVEGPLHLHGVGTLAADSAGGHSHGINVDGAADGSGSLIGNAANPGESTVNSILSLNITTTDGAHPHTISGSTATSGSNTPFPNSGPRTFMNVMIKL